MGMYIEYFQFSMILAKTPFIAAIRSLCIHNMIIVSNLLQYVYNIQNPLSI